MSRGGDPPRAGTRRRQGSSREPAVIIVGAGPAGIFTALELARLVPKARVLVIEKGHDLKSRRCPRQQEGGPCRKCPSCAVLSGWGGAGAFSDGKLNLSPEVGGALGDYLPSGESLPELVEEVDSIYRRHGAPRKLYEPDDRSFRTLESHFERNHLRLVRSRIRHMGTDGAREVLVRMRRSLSRSAKIAFSTAAVDLLVKDGVALGVRDRRGLEHRAPFTVLAPGRSGAGWLERQAEALGLERRHHPVDIGVRVEVPSSVMHALTDMLYEAKVKFNSPTFDDPVRTFCMCPEGEVVLENSGGVTLVNGQSYARKKTGRTNFAILVSTNFTEPFSEPIAYGKYIARLANILGGGVIVQRLGDLEGGRRSTGERISRGVIAPSLPTATPGDLSFVLPYRLLTGILEMITALGKAIPGLDSPETLLYGVEAKFYSLRLALGPHLETSVRNLFVVGDGAGVSRGLVQASASGMLVGREIARRLSQEAL